MRDRFSDGCEAQHANDGGMLRWLWVIPVTMALAFAYAFGISW